MRLRRRRDDEWDDGRRDRPDDGNWPADGGWPAGDGYYQQGAGGAGAYPEGYAAQGHGNQGYGNQGYGAAAQGYGEPGYGQAYDGGAGQQYGPANASYQGDTTAYGAPGYDNAGYDNAGYGAAGQGGPGYGGSGYGASAAPDTGRSGYGGAGYGDPGDPGQGGYGDPGQGGYGQQAYNGTAGGGPPWNQPNSAGAPGMDSAGPGGGGWNGEFAGAAATAQYGRLPAQEAGPAVPEFTPVDTPGPAGPAASSSGRPYGRLSIFTLLDDMAPEFDRLAERAAEGVRTAEPYTLVYVIHVVPKAPMQRIIYEIYRDRAAFEHHERQAHIQQFVADRRSCVLATNIIDLRLKYAKVAPLQGTPQPRQEPRAIESGNRPAAAADNGWGADSGDGRYPATENDRYAQAATDGYPAESGQYPGAANGYSANGYAGAANGYSGAANGYSGAANGHQYSGPANSQYAGAANGQYAGAADGQYAGAADGQYAGGADGQYPETGDSWFQPASDAYPQNGGQYQERGQGGHYPEASRLPESGYPGRPQAPDWDQPSYREQR